MSESCSNNGRKKKNKGAKVSPQKRAKIYARDGHRCLYCGTTEDLTLDHIIPRSKGGSNRYQNLRTLCRPCNMERSDNVDG